MKMVPVNFVWMDVDLVDDDGVVTRVKAMVPLARYGNVAARQFEPGEEYPLVVLEARTRKSHSHYFAAIHEGFQNLPEDLKMLKDRLGLKTIPPGGWINEEHLRKWALCETGWCDVGEFNFETDAEALRLVKFYRSKDPYCQINKRGNHVTIKEPKSQSAAAMAKQPFEESKRAVLDLIETMTGLKPGTLNKEAGKAA